MPTTAAFPAAVVGILYFGVTSSQFRQTGRVFRLYGSSTARAKEVSDTKFKKH
jgi:hypothetical protein